MEQGHIEVNYKQPLWDYSLSPTTKGTEFCQHHFILEETISLRGIQWTPR